MAFQTVTQVIIPLLTIGFSGILSAYIAHHLATTRADREFRLKRLEELFLSLTRFSKHYTVAVTPYLLVMRGQNTLAAVQEIIDKQTTSEDAQHLENIEMLIKIYFPSLNPHFDRILRLRDQIGERYIAELFNRVGRGHDCRDLAQGFLGEVQQFNEAAERLKTAIFALAENIRSRSWRANLRALLTDQFN